MRATVRFVPTANPEEPKMLLLWRILMSMLCTTCKSLEINQRREYESIVQSRNLGPEFASRPSPRAHNDPECRKCHCWRSSSNEFTVRAQHLHQHDSIERLVHSVPPTTQPTKPRTPLEQCVMCKHGG